MTCFTQSESSQTSAVSGQIYAGTESSFYPTSPEKDTSSVDTNTAGSLQVCGCTFDITSIFIELNISGIV